MGYGQKAPGMEDVDIIYAGSGHDIIFYNYGDVQEDGTYSLPDGLYINGGNGNDLLLVSKNMPSLEKLKASEKVDDVEVLLRATTLDSVNSLGITSHAALLTYGIALGEAGLLLDSSVWHKETEGGVTRYTNTEFTLENGKKILDDALELQVDDGVNVYLVAEGSNFAKVVGTTPTKAQLDALNDKGLITEVTRAPGQEDGNDDGGTESGSFGMRTMSLHGDTHDTADTGDTGDTEQTGGTVPEWLADRIDQAESTIRGAEDAPDVLIGTDVNEHIIGGSAGDFIDGGAGSDIIYAGGGDDLIVYDPTDYLIDGGEGIDFLLAGDAQASLGQLLNEGNGENGMPIVNNVEVLLKGVDTASLTSMDKLAEKFGLTLEKGPDGQDRLMVDMSQWDAGDGPDANGVTTWTNTAAPGVTMETTLQQTSEAEGQAVLTAKVAAETGGNN